MARPKTGRGLICAEFTRLRMHVLRGREAGANALCGLGARWSHWLGIGAVLRRTGSRMRWACGVMHLGIAACTQGRAFLPWRPLTCMHGIAGQNVEEAFLRTARKIYEAIQSELPFVCTRQTLHVLCHAISIPVGIRAHNQYKQDIDISKVPAGHQILTLLPPPNPHRPLPRREGSARSGEVVRILYEKGFKLKPFWQ